VSISDQDLEHRLRDQRGRVDYIAPPANNLAELTRQRHRALRRREIGLAGALVAAALVFVGVPVVADSLADADRGQVAHPSSTIPTDAENVYETPTRGSLADDDEWLQEVADLPWPGVDREHRDPGMEIAVAPVDTHKVAYADDVPAGRVALVLGISGQEVVHTWWVGPAGAAPDQMTLADYPALWGWDVMALVDGDPDAEELTLVVVADPTAYVQIDQVPVVDSQGVVVQGSQVLSLTDGVAVVSVDRRWAEAQPTVYVRKGDALDGVLVSQSPRADVGTPDPVAPADPHGQASDPGMRDWVNGNVGQLLRRYGLTADEGRPTVLAAAEGSGTSSTILLGMTFPSGATGLWLMTYDADDVRTISSITELGFQRAGGELLDQVFAVRFPAGFLVSAPSGVRADVLDENGALLGGLALTDGAGGGTVPQPYDARSVRILDAAGDVVGEAQIQDAG
jgi:hypothetical protein